MSSPVTIKDKIITDIAQLQSLKNIEHMPKPDQVLMVKPTYFSVDYVINPHMEGNIGTVDKEKALQEWQVIRDIFIKNGLTVHEVDGQPGMPDMVFSANQSLPFIDENGKKEVIMSLMFSDHRKNEVPYIEQWYRLNGYEIHHLDYRKVETFEGMGDAIWHHNRKLLWGGYGFRTSSKAYEIIAEKYDTPIIILELKNPSFYHLDTCMSILDEESVLIYPRAFTEDGLALIRSAFSHIVEAGAKEAERGFACNAASDGKNVVIQKGNDSVVSQMKKLGFTIHEVETGEYIKSGGSVFCMKCMTW